MDLHLQLLATWLTILTDPLNMMLVEFNSGIGQFVWQNVRTLPIDVFFCSDLVVHN